MKFAQKLKTKKILPFIDKKMNILDLGCGDMWLTKYLRKNGYKITGFSLTKPADIVGNVKTFKFKNNHYDVVIALEMVEHVDCFEEIEKMLKPDGLLILTTPTPHLDWFCLLMEKIGIFQSRGDTPHNFLIYMKDVPIFKTVVAKTYFFIQFGVFQKYRPSVG